MSDDAESNTGIEQPTNTTRLGRLTSLPGVRSVPGLGQEEARSTEDLIPVQRAFRGTHAIETNDGEAVIGAVRVTPAPMSMVDDLSEGIGNFASVLSAVTATQGMLIDVPVSADYSQRWKIFRDYQEELEDLINTDNVDDDALWPIQCQADLCEERAGNAKLYERTTTRREHYIVLKVTQREAAEAIAGDRGEIQNLRGVGRFVRDRRIWKLEQSDRLTELMVELLERRLEKLNTYLNKMNAADVTSTRVPSTEFAQVIANHYRGEDISQQQNFTSLVRRSPISIGNEDPEYDLHHPDAMHTSALMSEEGRIRQFKSLLAPETFDPEYNDAITIDGTRRAATLQVTGWPEVPQEAFLEPLYQFDHSGVELTIATHWTNKSVQKARRDAKKRENSLEDKRDGKIGSVFEDKLERRLQEARGFSQSIEYSDYGVFNVGLFIHVTAPTQTATGEPGESVESDKQLNDAIDEITMILTEECGLTVSRLTHSQEEGWQTTAPVCNNEIGTNVTVLGEGLARQFPYQYKNISEPGGIKIGLHEYLREPAAVNILNPKFRPNGYNGGVYGMIGSGKTVSMQELATALKLYHDAVDDDLTLVLSTPVQDFKSICDAFDGEHITIGGETGINVLDIKPIPREKLEDDRIGLDAPWKAMLDRGEGFLQIYYEREGLVDYGDKKQAWLTAIKAANRFAGIIPGKPETYHRPSPTLRDVIYFLKDMVYNPELYVDEDMQADQESLEGRSKTARKIVNNDIGGFSEHGRYEHFARRTTIDLESNDVFYVDLQQKEGDEDGGGLMMMMVLEDLYEQAKATSGKTFFGIDEFHYMLKNPRSKQFFEHIHRHSRHWQMAIWLATQEFDDLFEETDDGTLKKSESAKVIFREQSMQLFHSAKGVDEWGHLIDVSHRSLGYIKNATSGKKGGGFAQALLVVDDTEYPLRIEMSDDLNPRQFALYQHDPTDEYLSSREYLENYRDDDGTDPCDWRWVDRLSSKRSREPPSVAAAAPEVETATEMPTRTTEAPVGDEAGVSAPSTNAARNGDSEEDRDEDANLSELQTMANGHGGVEANAENGHERARNQEPSSTDLTDISGVGETTAETLRDAGITTVEDIRTATVGDLNVADGIGPARAEELIEAAKNTHQGTDEVGSDPHDDSPEVE